MWVATDKNNNNRIKFASCTQLLETRATETLPNAQHTGGDESCMCESEAGTHPVSDEV